MVPLPAWAEGGKNVNIHLFFSVSSLEFKTVALHYNLIDYCKAKKKKKERNKTVLKNLQIKLTH